MRSGLALLALALVACGEAPAPPPSSTTARPEPLPPPRYALHEWGLLAYEASATHDDVLVASSPLVEADPLGLGPEAAGLGVSAYEPVLYVHADAPVDLDVRVRAPRGRFVETFPEAEWTEGAIHWAPVHAVPALEGGCHASYPSPPDAPCATRDGYCEASNGASYEASDGACLSLGSAPARYDYLLYRAAIGRESFPLRVAASAEGYAITTAEGATPVRVFRVRRSFESDAFASAAFDAPPAGSTMTVPSTDETANAHLLDALLAGLTDAGLTVPERDAFARAWHDAIVPEPAAGTMHSRFGAPERDVLADGARPPEDALYYWLPAAAADAALPIELTPPPTEVHRALLVRVALVPDAPRLLTGQRVVPSGLELTDRLDASGLAADVARRVLLRHLNEIRYCAAQADLATSTTLRFAIALGATGAVTVERETSEPASAILDSCARAAFTRWTFPAPESGHATISGTMTYEPPPE